MTSILITIQPSVTVITAETMFYRYDKPGPVELAEYCFTLVGGVTAPHSVTVAAEITLAESVAAECAALGFEASTTPLIDEALVNLPPTSPEEDAAPDTDRFLNDGIEDVHRPAPSGEPGNSKWSMVLLSVAACGVLAAGLWAVASTVTDSDEVSVDNVAAGMGIDQASESSTAIASPETPPETSPSISVPEPEDTSVVLSQDGLSVELPVGFQLDADGDMWKAEGDDPDLRLHLAVDELYGLPPEQLLAQVEDDVEADPELSMINMDEAGVEYHQSAPDGSEAMWFTTIEDGKQVSLGCHTRNAPTAVQRATCTMARESMTYHDPA